MSTPTDTPLTDAAMFCIGCGADGNGTPRDVVDATLVRNIERLLALAEQERDEANRLLVEAGKFASEVSETFSWVDPDEERGQREIQEELHKNATELLAKIKAIQPQAAPGDGGAGR